MSYYPTLSRGWSPFAEIRREMDRIFDDATSASDRGQVRGMDSQWSPTCEIEEAEGHYLISLELAGVPKEQVKVEFHDDQLVISGERRKETQAREHDGQYYTERRFGKFQRAFTLPPGTDPAKVEASQQDGVLRVYVPKAEAVKPREIKVTSGPATGFFAKLLNGAGSEKAAS